MWIRVDFHKIIKAHIKDAISNVLTVFFVLVMVVSALYVGRYYYGTYRQRNLDSMVRGIYESLEPRAPAAGPSAAASGFPAHAPQRETEPDSGEDFEGGYTYVPHVPPNLERMAPLLEINGDFVAMLLIPGLDMVLPVVQGTDNDYYLNITFEGVKDPRGTVFLDYKNRNNFMDRNSVLYGHYMNDGTMFHDLFKYKNINTYLNAPIIQVESIHGMTTWLIFAAYTCEPTYAYFHTEFPNDTFGDIVQEMQRRSLFTTEIDVTANDKLLTLSTCDYDFEDARFAVHARQLREGETLPIRFSAQVNANRQPYIVPFQQRFAAIAANGLSAIQHPQTNALYFYQYGEGGIERYVGNFNNVQGPYAAYTGGINPERVSWVASGVSHAPGRQYYIVTGGLQDDTPGLFLLQAHSATEPFNFTRRQPLTPEGEDAKWPVLHVDHAGRVYLLYTVADDEERETLYRLLLFSDEPPLRILRGEAGDSIRPVGIIDRPDGIPLIFWKENDILRVLGGQVYYPEEAGKLQFIYHRINQRWVAITEQNGQLRTDVVDIDNIVSPYVPPPQQAITAPIDPEADEARADDEADQTQN
jgi:sortase B